jgi:NtrC-family two-component system sensor histidine kinase KinB
VKPQHFFNLNIKTKIIFALLILFATITFLGLLGSHYLDRTANDSVAMMQDNYRSIQNTREMSLALQEMVQPLQLLDMVKGEKRKKIKSASSKFERHLNLQSNKYLGEEETRLTEELRGDFTDFRDRILDSLSTDGAFSYGLYFQGQHLNALLKDVYELNEASFTAKTNQANEIADRITMYSIIIGFFFIGFMIFSLFYFPTYIADPIRKLTEGIKQIAQKNYRERLPVKSGDEFGEMAHSFNLMAKKLEEYDNININQILSEKQRIETIISQTNEAIVGLDNQKCVLFVNPIAEKLLGISEEEVLQKPASELALKSDIFANLVKEILNDEIKEDQTINAVSIDKNGEQLYFNKEILIVQNTDIENITQGSGYIFILKNITELKTQDLAKNNFMATLSHELKTPIAAIGMSLKLIEDERIGHLNEEQKDLTDTIRHNANRLLKMVNEVLDISKIETGNVQLNYEEISAAKVIDRALSNVKTFIDEKDIQIKKSIKGETGNLKLDVLKTTGVLTNFLTNALRYSENGKPIEINVVRNNGTVKFSVKDYGPGISQEDQGKVFKKYQRAKDDKTKGTGLGLAISKEFIEAQGGKIWMESEVGKGSQFWFSLPV